MINLNIFASQPEPGADVPDGPRVVGVDTSLKATGLASSEGWCRVIGYDDKKNPITKLPHRERLVQMRRILNTVTAAIGHPDLAVMETAALSRAGGGAHERGWLWWRIYEWITDEGIPLGLVSTNQRILYATGKGTGAKTAVVDAVARRWPQWQTGGNDNAADGVTLMAAGRDWLGNPITDMPKAHRAAVEKAAWPGVQR
jgi:crossover junction endodeoxyribonuclease RuvC